jgi:hypothetical protein
MSTPAIDARTMSMEDLKNLIISQNLPLEGVTEEAATDQPRDGQGRFIAVPDPAPVDPPPAVDQDPPAEPETVTVEKEIDLGDGSGIQIFRGVGPTREAALEALADEFAKAQTNATKKIQELSRKPDPAPAAPTPEEAFLLQQQLLDNPQATLDRLMEKKFAAYEAQKKAEKDAAAERDQKEAELASRFMAANPDYYAVQQNGKRLERQLAIEGLPTTLENLQKVYNDLKADGLITAKPTEAAPVIRTRSSGLSTRSGVPAPPPKAVDISKLTTEQLRELSGGYQNVYR